MNGLLGEYLSVPCIIEILRWGPDVWQLQDCLRHWLTWKSEASKSIMSANETSVGTPEARSDVRQEVDKTLLIIVPSIASQHLQGFAARRDMNISGIYELAPAFCTTIIVKGRTSSKCFNSLAQTSRTRTNDGEQQLWNSML